MYNFSASCVEVQGIGSNAVSSNTLHEVANKLTWQMTELMKQVDHLGEQIDRISRSKDETPPALRTMQIQMSEMAHALDEVAAMPAMVRQFDDQVKTLLEEIKTVRARIEAAQGVPSGRTPAVTLSTAVGAPGSP